MDNINDLLQNYLKKVDKETIEIDYNKQSIINLTTDNLSLLLRKYEIFKKVLIIYPKNEKPRKELSVEAYLAFYLRLIKEYVTSKKVQFLNTALKLYSIKRLDQLGVDQKINNLCMEILRDETR